jgi:uncharacterized protein (TIGR02145 family)
VRDGGKTYETVVIGTQTWMAKNLDFETPTGSKCYNDKDINCVMYGRLYDWETAMTACPAGWHLPSDMEWVVLEEFIGGSVEDAWKKLRAKSGWGLIGTGNGTDDYGFAALPSDGNFSGAWWSSTKYTNYSYNDRAYYRSEKGEYSSAAGLSNTYSVRCVKGDNSPSPSLSSPPYTPVSCPSVPANGFCDDRDGKAYKSTLIDGKTWMAENLNFNAEGSVCYDNNPANCATYGKLYDWVTAMAFEPACNKADCISWVAEKHKGICPNGWHVPNRTEFQELVSYAGGSSTAGQALKATSGWTDSEGNPSGNGADLLGFSALPGGNGSYITGYGYLWFSASSFWWSSTGYDGDRAYKDDAYYLSIGSSSGAGTSYGDKYTWHSLRCVRD